MDEEGELDEQDELEQVGELDELGENDGLAKLVEWPVADGKACGRASI